MAYEGLEFLTHKLPPPLHAIVRLATNLRWIWNHATDRVWEALSPDVWHQTRNPILVMQNTPRSRLEELARNREFIERLLQLDHGLSDYLARPSWFQETQVLERAPRIAYFSMEYGLTEALPLYSGGLGVLAGDHLKTASDLGVPVTGVGLFYREGYFRQMLNAAGAQVEIYSINSPDSLPVRPVLDAEGMPMRVTLELPGRELRIRVWRASVGRVDLYLLDSDDPLNSAFDRGITAQLYGGDGERRLLQEIVLGIGGWRALEALGIEADVCHLNEGHAALATVERARSFVHRHGTDFFTALWATRGGNVFTTHTPVAAAFDTFPRPLLENYAPAYARSCGLTPAQLMGLGRVNPGDAEEPFNMAYLAARTCAWTNGVSQLHGRVSRRIFAPLYPRWPEPEVPVMHVTNAVHVPSWDSPWADHLWTEACGKERWLGNPQRLSEAVARLSDAQIWTFRAMERRDLVEYARRRLQRQLSQRGQSEETIAAARHALDPNVLTLGFARRFTEYKRPAMLLAQPERLARLLADPIRPVQLIIAGKAHPRDEPGHDFVQRWARFVQNDAVRARIVFLEDYDMALAEQLVQGVDVWINTPRRPWEASGTSGMKVLVNGGLNLSELDGWWAEAFSADVGWALGDGREHAEPGWDAVETEQLFSMLEREVVPLFYQRDAEGIPRAWVSRIRASLATLTPQFSSNRMLAEYLERLYLPAARLHWARSGENLRHARALREWYRQLRQHWQEIHWGNVERVAEADAHVVRAQVYLGDIPPESVRVQLFAENGTGAPPECLEMQRDHALSGSAGGFLYVARLPLDRADRQYTPRVVAWDPRARLPAEANFIRWYPQ
ncbi:MAG: glycosyltransferase family 1 protein [Gammaproteobacteria bacterium]|nr:glycosyltransferase family 1 protein [Gammaproteobacteria bacterium]